MVRGVVELANEVHDELLKLVTPASPASIRASSFQRARNPALFAILVFAVISFVVFVTPMFITALAGSDDANLDELKSMLQIVGGAGLGSAFYSLYTASFYIKTGTFDPKYNSIYWIRFLIGVLSGLILAYFLRDFLTSEGTAANGGNASRRAAQLYHIGVPALALIGGYAADAVARILDRVSETLVALISGSDKDKIDAARQKADADAQMKTAQVNSETVRRLQTALAADDVPKAVRTVMDGLLR